MSRRLPSLRAAALSSLLSSSSTARTTPFFRALTTATTASSSSQAPPATASPARKPRPFIVARTPSNNLAVYQDARSGGTNKFTLIRKVGGDARALRQALLEELPFADGDVRLNPVTGHISVKGWHHKTIVNWLTAQGF
ncbi:hypothetical protein NKR23_g5847 [Pleurostoma richardsiae]|uniref:Large ribosomal subunit protein mL49 n=1 Tax=Pleurostoma richardsiae TaxID=41990 RepID=A0AA38S0X5_9PEZI|nr:hypothetical protein NKR23_g5847 [Pleurostoma richardsiae]